MASDGCRDPAGVVVCIREDGQTLPLMIRPEGGNNSVDFLKSWIAENKQWLNDKLLEHGEPGFVAKRRRVWLQSTNNEHLITFLCCNGKLIWMNL